MRMLENRRSTHKQAYCQSRVENPPPLVVAKRAQQQKEKGKVQPRPDSTHPFEIAEKAVIARGREKRRHECGGDKSNESPENRLVPQVQIVATGTKRPHEYQ